MDTSASQQKASNAKGWIVIAAVVLMVTPFGILAMRKSPAAASPATTGMVWIKGGEFTMGSDKADE